MNIKCLVRQIFFLCWENLGTADNGRKSYNQMISISPHMYDVITKLLKFNFSWMPFMLWTLSLSRKSANSSISLAFALLRLFLVVLGADGSVGIKRGFTQSNTWVWITKILKGLTRSLTTHSVYLVFYLWVLLLFIQK